MSEQTCPVVYDHNPDNPDGCRVCGWTSESEEVAEIHAQIDDTIRFLDSISDGPYSQPVHGDDE